MAVLLKPLAALPLLGDLMNYPSLVSTLTMEAAQKLLVQATADLASIQTLRDVLLVRIATASSITSTNQRTPDSEKMLTVAEASQRLRRSRQWLYRNAERLPFVKRISRKSMLISEAGLERWLSRRHA